MKKQFVSRVSAFALLFNLWSPAPNRAATLVVYSSNDAGPGTLRQAIQDNNALGGGNAVVFSNIVSGPITLLSGGLLVTRDVTIVGPGQQLLTVSGNSASRIFHLTNNANVAISGLTIANGVESRGAGIRQDSGTLDLQRCILSNHVAFAGGGIHASGVVAVAECLFTRNRGDNDGAGIYQLSGSLTVSNCTFSHNTNTSRGGAMTIGVGATTTALINNCTFASNSAIFGGALIIYGIVGVSNCTFSGNRGAIHNTSSGSITVRNSVLAGNSTAGSGDASGAFISGGYNLIGAGDGSTGWTGLADQVGSVNAPINPLLGPLQVNGGLTPTMALLPGSPAIDQGHTAGSLLDQRGGARPHDKSIPNATGGDGSDIGAFEVGGLTRFTDIRRGGSDIRVSFTTDLANNYALQRRDDIATGLWSTVATNIAGTGGTVTVTNIAATAAGFYRVQSLP
jgi:hypothetical protein